VSNGDSGVKKRTFIIRTDAFLQELIRHLRGLDLGKPKQIVVSDYRRKHTISQRGLYFVWMHQIGQDTGHTKDEMHQYFKHSLLAPQTLEINGHVVDVPPSIAKLNTEEMSDYMTQIQAFCGTELGLMLSIPEGKWAA